MAPLILVTTVITHLFGGSAGREGTAVQIGGSLANLFGGWLKLNEADKKVVLTAGVAAGFGAVFGTPLTGAIFALEVIAIGRIRYNALLPCLIAGLVGDITVSAWGMHHTLYHVDIVNTSQDLYGLHLPVSLWLLAKVIVASAVFGLVSLGLCKGRTFSKKLLFKMDKDHLAYTYLRRVNNHWVTHVYFGQARLFKSWC
jgi:H+/Cl- antiporter ClcA